jgi:tRNA A37 threonylcarbamoyladenosine synthetase subunit TsaC/SUA5/YrdC
LIAPGEIDPMNDAEQIRDRFQKLIQAVLDAGACSMLPTTVVDLSGPSAVLLRRGQGDPALLGLALDADNET